MNTDFVAIRRAIAKITTDHDAVGEHRPTVGEIFTPEQHANALDPNTPVVVGARGTGKSFWAGVLEQADTRQAAALAYPNLGLDKLLVRPGYTGFAVDGAVTAKIIDARVPLGEESALAADFWHAVILRAAKSALKPEQDMKPIRDIMRQYADPEDLAYELKQLDSKIAQTGQVLLITFDALDTLSRDWQRASLLLDALLEVIWTLRARRAIRAKIFIRPEQLNDENLTFIELPKLRSSRVELNWSQSDLYGLLFVRLAAISEGKKAFGKLATGIGAPIPANLTKGRRRWPLIDDPAIQKLAMEQLAGPYMGYSHKKGGTYDWPYKHLGDANGKVTPRSFLKLFVTAAQLPMTGFEQAISAEGIREGLREASKVRVDQLVLEYKWVKRALAPLAGLTIPCTIDAIAERWDQTDTIKLILKAATDTKSGFLPPFRPRSRGNHAALLVSAMERIGMLSYRSDDRIDIPDLFRVAALMLKRGGTTPVKTI